MAVVGTQTVATLIAVYGLFMTPLGWGWAAFVWGYALAWFVLNDRVKLLAYRVLDRKQRAPSAEAPLDLAPQVATRAYEIYERQGRRDGHATEDWLAAEREIRNEQPSPTKPAHAGGSR
jgi:H+-transporting ATPase